MVTIKDVSKFAQVSTSTVSRVVTRNGIVSDVTRDKVLNAIDTLGYQPNFLAQGLKNRKSNVIGVVITDMCSPFYSFMLRGIENVIIKEKKNMIVCSGHGDTQIEKQAIDSLLGNQCEALILNMESSIEDTQSIFSDLIRKNVPTIMMGGFLAKEAEYSVIIDNEHGGYLATRYLIDKGHRKIVHLTGQQEYCDTRDRLKGFKRALKEAGIQYDDRYVIEGEFDNESGFNETCKLLENDLEFSAIFAGDDEIAVGVIDALRSKGRKIPEDVSVVGFDDMFFSRFMHPKLTTIRQPITEMGTTASQMAMDIIKGKKITEKRKVFKPKLIERLSVIDMDPEI